MKRNRGKKSISSNSNNNGSSVKAVVVGNTTTTSTTSSLLLLQQQEALWKPIDVSELQLRRDDGNESNDTKRLNNLNADCNSSNTIFNQNHYDNDDDNDIDNEDNHDGIVGEDLATDTDRMGKKQQQQQQKGKKKKKQTLKSADYDLVGQSHESMAFFYSLEVMDGNAVASLIRNNNNTSNNNSNTTIMNASTTTKTNTTMLSKSDHDVDTTKKSAKKEKKKNSITTTTTSMNDDDDDEHDSIPIPRTKQLTEQQQQQQSELDTTTATNEASNKTKSKKKKEKEQPKQQQQNTDTTKEDDDHTIAVDDTAAEIITNNNNNDENEATATTAAIQQLQSIWMKECYYTVQLHDCICTTLYEQQWYTPTPIQAMTLSATILGKQNCVGAAPTGSGKTLAYLLPIFHTLFTNIDNTIDNTGTNNIQQQPLPLQAIILTPTRELALQIYNVGTKFCIPYQKSSSSSTSSLSKQTQYQKYSSISMACITGGLAMTKQLRILQSKYRPPTIIVGTPGRLYELMNDTSIQHLQNLSCVRFVVIDEADQMIDMISHNHTTRYKKFPELIKILNRIHEANPLSNDDDNEIDHGADHDDDDDDMDVDRMIGLPGIPGEAKVQMINDTILEQMMEQQKRDMMHDDIENVNYDDDDDILITTTDDDIAINDGNDEDDDNISLPVLPPVHRQTFVFSATLTLSSSNSDPQNKTKNTNNKAKDGNNNKKRRRDTDTTDHHSNNNDSSTTKLQKLNNGAIADLLQKAHAVGRTKIVDLSNTSTGGTTDGTTTKSKNQATNDGKNEFNTKPLQQQFQFPPGLQFLHIQCTQRHKDSHLYAYLLYFIQQQQPNIQHSQSILIFCNSIAGVRRVGMTLTTLRLPVRMLHAQMQQRSRFKAIESLQQHQNDDTDDASNKLVVGTNINTTNTKLPTIVVATDVAARGLDIPSVATVIHYDAARTVDTFVHRSGRTARGIGEGAVGSSLSIVASGEDQFHNKIIKSLNVQFNNVPIDGRLLRLAQERVNLACKVAISEDTERKKQRDDQWFIDQGKEAGLEIDDDLLNNSRNNDDDEVGKHRDTSKVARIKAARRDAEIARKKLNELLNQPVQTQRYGKFLSTIMIQQHSSVRPTTNAIVAATKASSATTSTATIENKSNKKKRKMQRK